MNVKNMTSFFSKDKLYWAETGQQTHTNQPANLNIMKRKCFHNHNGIETYVKLFFVKKFFTQMKKKQKKVNGREREKING